MNVIEMLDELEKKALHDKALRLALLETRTMENPLQCFCKKCQELGYEIYPMDVVNAGEDFYGSMRRSTNGGGENSPKLDGEDDFFELFMTSLQSVQE